MLYASQTSSASDIKRLTKRRVQFNKDHLKLQSKRSIGTYMLYVLNLQWDYYSS